MGWAENSLTVDDWGVRVGDEEFPVRAFSWDAVTRIRAYVVGVVGGAFSVIELHHGGEREEILDDWEDFLGSPPDFGPPARYSPGLVGYGPGSAGDDGAGHDLGSVMPRPVPRRHPPRRR